MFITEYEGHDLTKYNIFLMECTKRDYTGLGTHKHHIIPKGFMGGTNKKDNLITLSYEDHYTAHLILAECFPKGNIHRAKNYASAKLVLGHVKGYLTKKYGNNLDENLPTFWNIANKDVRSLCSGENNPMYGKKLTVDQCQKMSKDRKGKFAGSDNPFYGKTHTEESKTKIKEKRAKQVFTEEVKKRQISALLLNNKKGSDNPLTGKTYEEIYGIDYATEIKKKISQAGKLRYENIDLPDGIFKCYVVVNGYVKNYYRHCPNCSSVIYYTCSRDRANLFRSHKNGSLCRKCSNKK